MNHFLRPQYTDLAVVLGVTARQVEVDCADLVRAYPEVLLGYRVLLATPNRVMRGYWISKLVVLDPGQMWTPQFDRALQDTLMSVLVTDFGKAEGWRVHRGRGIERIW